MPFMSFRTLLVHDKALLRVFSESGSEFTDIIGPTDIAGGHKDCPSAQEKPFVASVPVVP
jgi:hypothetical protein